MWTRERTAASQCGFSALLGLSQRAFLVGRLRLTGDAAKAGCESSTYGAMNVVTPGPPSLASPILTDGPAPSCCIICCEAFCLKAIHCRRVNSAPAAAPKKKIDTASETVMSIHTPSRLLRNKKLGTTVLQAWPLRESRLPSSSFYRIPHGISSVTSEHPRCGKQVTPTFYSSPFLPLKTSSRCHHRRINGKPVPLFHFFLAPK